MCIATWCWQRLRLLGVDAENPSTSSSRRQHVASYDIWCPLSLLATELTVSLLRLTCDLTCTPFGELVSIDQNVPIAVRTIPAAVFCLRVFGDIAARHKQGGLNASVTADGAASRDDIRVPSRLLRTLLTRFNVRCRCQITYIAMLRVIHIGTIASLVNVTIRRRC